MPLEAVMIVVDNSESSRNGDYTPTRFEAQADAVSLIFSSITQGNPESSVGLMAMGGKGPEVLATLTEDHGKILDGLHRTKTHIRGRSHLATGIQIAHLALKHRKNHSQRQRIIVFTCSPVAEDEKTLVRLAKKMKKLSISIDFVVFGELDDDVTRKLTTFNETVKGAEGSHMAIIPPGPGLLSDQLLSSPIMNGDGAGATGDAGQDGGDSTSFPFGIDPSVDPELALALRMSLDDEKLRLEREQQDKDKADKPKETLPDIKEQDEAAPLLNPDGQANEGGDSKKDPQHDDKMDTS